MSDNEKLATDILMAGASGKLDVNEVGGMLSVLAGAPLLRVSRDPVTGVQQIHDTLDAKGKVLVAGGVYLLDGKRVKVLREEFGGGNVMDTYYRVYYLDSEFVERFVVADARFENGTFGRRVYRTRLEPTNQEPTT